VNEVIWRKSSYSGEGNCVEVGNHATVNVLVRDTKDRTGTVLEMTPQAWRAFAHRLKVKA
jgi:Domain of unknown function (DUF397)